MPNPDSTVDRNLLFPTVDFTQRSHIVGPTTHFYWRFSRSRSPQIQSLSLFFLSLSWKQSLATEQWLTSPIGDSGGMLLRKSCGG